MVLFNSCESVQSLISFVSIKIYSTHTSDLLIQRIIPMGDQAFQSPNDQCLTQSGSFPEVKDNNHRF